MPENRVVELSEAYIFGATTDLGEFGIRLEVNTVGRVVTRTTFCCQKVS